MGGLRTVSFIAAELFGTKPGAVLAAELKKDKVHLLVLDAKLNGDAKAGKVDAWFQDPELPWRK